MTLKYKIFSQLMASIESDLNTFTDEGFVNRGKYIKEARKINESLGFKISREKEHILNVKDYKAQLPEDFMQLQLALACHVSYARVPILRAPQTESHIHKEECDIKLKTKHFNPSECNEGQGQNIWVTQKIGAKIETFTHLEKLQLTQKSLNRCADHCFNKHFKNHNVIDIQEDEAVFSFREGKVYINYLADMISEDGDILILDHPLVNDYYEYAIKKKIIENMKLNKEGDFAQDLQYLIEELRKAKITAMSFVAMPEYDEIVKVVLENRKRFYKKYIDYFDELKDGYYNI